MKIVASVCAGIALVASIAAVNSWLELQKVREANAALRKQPVEVSRRVGSLAAPTPDTALPATVAATAPQETPVSRTESSTPTPVMDAECKSLDVAEAQRQLFKDPEYRKSYLATARMTVRSDHRGLARELSLSEDEAEKLFDLLADNRLAQGVEGANRGSNMDQQALQEARRTGQELDRKLEESIQALLGSKYAQWQAYRSAHSLYGPGVSRMVSRMQKSLAAQQAQAQEPRILPANQTDQAKQE